MELVELGLNSLPEEIVLQVQSLITECVKDCESRPGEKATRKVNITLSIGPRVHMEMDERQNKFFVIRGINLGFHINHVLPKRKALEYDCGISAEGNLLFNPNSPWNHLQKSLPGLNDDTLEGRTVPMNQQAHG